ncbi:MAG TPA: glycosyltransferase family 4 protein [Ktedonosporobacter sp.]|nr:glycosyltransferase family 4 protein [Ktedonosporobacter sp.]
MRILIVSLEYPPSSIGGYGVMCAQVCEWLRQQGHDLLILTTIPLEAHTEQGRVEREGSIPVRRVLHSYWDGSACLYPPLLDALAIERANQRQFQEILAEYQPDVVSFWHMGDMSLGLITITARLEVPIVFVIGDDWLCYGGWTDAWIRRFWQHPKHADAVERQTGIPTRLPDLGSLGTFCFVSDYTRRRAENKGGWRIPHFDITFPGISRTEFPPLPQIPDHPWKWNILWIGRVIEEKGIVTAINALGALPGETILQVVGPVDLAYRRHLEEVATTLGVADYLSFSLTARQEVGLRYQQADVTLFTSMIEHEAFGLVPLEAMASGCPVISTCVGGSGEYCIDGVNCLQVSPGDAEALAHAVQKLATNPDLRHHLIKGGLQTADELTLDRQAKRIEHLLLSAAATYKGGNRS